MVAKQPSCFSLAIVYACSTDNKKTLPVKEGFYTKGV